MNKSRSLRFVLLLLISTLLLPIPVYAQEDDTSEPPNGLTMTAVAGYDGFYRSDQGVPVIINVANNGPAIEGNLRLVVGTNSFNNQVIYESPISLPTQSEKRVPLYVHLPSTINQLTIQLRDDNNDLIYAADTNTLSQVDDDSLLYGIASPDPGEYSFLESVTGTRARAEVAFLDLAQLPDVPPVWNALDVLVIDEVDTAELTTEQLDALLGWIHTGGQLVVTGGPGWQKSTAVTRDLLPVTPTGSESVDDLPALSQEMGYAFRDDGPYIVTTSTLNGGGELLYHQDGLPILARQEMGRGAVYFLALDPKLAPLRDWDGSDVLWSGIAASVPESLIWSVRNSYSPATAVSSLPSLALPSTLQLVLFLFIYVIIVGPVNYIVLKRRGRLERSWITIPLIVIFFTVLAYFTGFQLKGNDIIINQMSIAQGQMGSDYMRVQTPLGIYSPNRDTYNIDFDYANLVRPFDRGSTPIGGSGNIDAITRSSQLTMSGARIDISDVATFIADSYQPLPDITGEAIMYADGDSAYQDLTLDIYIQNNTDLDLENAVAFLGSTPIDMGNIAAQDAQTVSEIIGVTSGGVSSYYGGSSGQPLLDNAALILGTANYYNDRDAYPRWELLQAVQGDYYSGGGSVPRFSVDTVTLVAWAQQPQIDVQLETENIQNQAVTLYLLEIPLTQQIVSTAEEISIPTSLLNWDVLATSGVYNPTPFNFYMGEGWVEFEFQPWQEFRDIDVQDLTLVMEPQYADGQMPPTVSFWNWQTDNWDELVGVTWGQESLAEFGSYIGPNTIIRIRVENSNPTSVDIGEIYPLLTGTIN